MITRKCYYHYDKEAGKVLIPGCWPVVHSNDMSDCTCRLSLTPNQIVKKEYSEEIRKYKELIKQLEKENARLYRILRKTNGFKK